MQKICVYCGSNSGTKHEYTLAAHDLAKELVERNISLVYGGTHVGLMGEIADQVLAKGGEVIGVIPQYLVAKEIAHPGLTQLHVVDSMHARKTQLMDLADGFIAMPGGLGTLDELFEVLAWAQLGLHTKPCGLLNVCQYYTLLSTFLKHAENEHFLKPAHRNMILIENSPKALFQKFMNYRAPSAQKWTPQNNNPILP